MDGAWHEQPRDARVWVSGQLIAYPFQQHFEMLDDTSIVEECRGHQVDAAQVARSANFEEWILRRFGNGVARNFMMPYNRKLWARDLKDMSCEWVAERVATATEPGPTTAATPRRRPLQSDSRVAYPAHGGFGSIFVALAARCERIELGEEVVRIDLHNRNVHTSSGTRLALGPNRLDHAPAALARLPRRLRGPDCRTGIDAPRGLAEDPPDPRQIARQRGRGS